MILAGDIGGTKTVLALWDTDGDSLHLVRETSYPSRGRAAFEELLALFLTADKPIALEAACFGVAGAVIEGQVKTTNLPWLLDERALAHVLNAPRVKLLNDLEAMAFGMLVLNPEELYQINAGAIPKRQGNVAVIAAGTGLGEAILYWDGRRHHPMASEGGHCDFAPRTEREVALLLYLQKKYGGHVSYERLLSGPGFFNIYSFLRDTGVAAESPELAAALAADEANAVISQRGLAKADPLCALTVELFAEIYGAEAGNLALKCVATGGVYIGGGIAPKLLPAFVTGAFLRGFSEKGRFTDLLRSFPVSIATNPKTPLLGAAHYAGQMANE